MKPQETLFACLIVGAVAGAASGVAAGFFLGDARSAVPARGANAAAVPLESTAEAVPGSDAGRELNELRMSNASLATRVQQLEARLGELTASAARQPLASGAQQVPSEEALNVAAALGQGQVTPTFIASVDQALDTIRAREEEEREAKRKELRAQRIEERLVDLREKLGLSGTQVRDMRTTLLTQEEKREALFETMRDGGGDRRSMFEGMRTIRDETNASLQSFLTPAQFDGYSQTEDGRGWDGGPPPDGGGRRGGGGFGGGDTGGGGRRGR